MTSHIRCLDLGSDSTGVLETVALHFHCCVRSLHCTNQALSLRSCHASSHEVWACAKHMLRVDSGCDQVSS